MFLLHNSEFIMWGEKSETSTQNLQRNNVVLQVQYYCILYFATFIRILRMLSMVLKWLTDFPGDHWNQKAGRSKVSASPL